MKRYLQLIRRYDSLSDQVVHHAGAMTQAEFNRKIAALRRLVKQIWAIRDSGKITL